MGSCLAIDFFRNGCTHFLFYIFDFVAIDSAEIQYNFNIICAIWNKAEKGKRRED